MVGAQIGEDILISGVDESFEEIVRDTVTAHTLDSLCFHVGFRLWLLFDDGVGVRRQG
jgi:hypothetical protein